MICEGTVRDGVVVLPPDVYLPDGLLVSVQPIRPQTRPATPAKFSGTMRNGVPVFPFCAVEKAPDLELVNELRDQAP